MESPQGIVANLNTDAGRGSSAVVEGAGFFASAACVLYRAGAVGYVAAAFILFFLSNFQSETLLPVVAVGFFMADRIHASGRRRLALCVAACAALVVGGAWTPLSPFVLAPTVWVVVLALLASSNGGFSQRFVVSFIVSMVTLWVIGGLSRGSAGGLVFDLGFVEHLALVVVFGVSSISIHARARGAERRLRTAMAGSQAFSRRDPTTGLLTRSAMLEVLEREISRSRRSTRPFALALVGVDGFDLLSGSEGEDCAEWIMATLADLVRNVVRCEDRMARWEGERVLVLLRETDLDGARAAARRLRAEIDRSAFVFDNREISFSLTMAISSGHGELDLEAHIEGLSDALEAAQKAGGDRVAEVAAEPS